MDKGAIEAALKADLEWHARVTRRRDRSIGVGQVMGDWLFAEDSFASLCGGDDRIRVKAGWGGDHHSFDGRVGQQVVVVERPALTAKPGRMAFGQARLWIGETDQSRARSVAREIFGVMGAH